MTSGMIHGRFQPFHNGHLEYLRGAAARSDEVFVGITNPDPSRVKEEPSDPLYGPFIETKDQMGGIVLLEVRDLDEAIAWAERCPGSYSVEIRPIMDYEAYARYAASAEGAAS